MYPKILSNIARTLPLVLMGTTLVLGVVAYCPPAMAAADQPPLPQPPMNLQGFWQEGQKKVRIVQTPDHTVQAWYIEDEECDPRDETPVRKTTLDFEATLSGNRLSGQVNACHWGENNPLGTGFKFVPLQLTVSADGQTLKGTWWNMLRHRPEPLMLTRLCQPDQVTLCSTLQSVYQSTTDFVAALHTNRPSLSFANWKSAIAQQFAQLSQEYCNHPEVLHTLTDKVITPLAALESPQISVLEDMQQELKILRAIFRQSGGACQGFPTSHQCDAEKICPAFNDAYQSIGKVLTTLQDGEEPDCTLAEFKEQHGEPLKQSEEEYERCGYPSNGFIRTSITLFGTLDHALNTESPRRRQQIIGRLRTIADQLEGARGLMIQSGGPCNGSHDPSR